MEALLEQEAEEGVEGQNVVQEVPVVVAEVVQDCFDPEGAVAAEGRALGEVAAAAARSEVVVASQELKPQTFAQWHTTLSRYEHGRSVHDEEVEGVCACSGNRT